MFRDDYKNIMNGVSLSDAARQKIVENLANGGAKPINRTARRSAVLWRISYAAVACAIALTVLILPHGKGVSPVTESVVLTDLPASTDYGEIYRAVKKSQKQVRLYAQKGYNFVTNDALALEDEMETVNETAAAKKSANGVDDYTKTNTQVEGVDEADIIKTDGEYIYSLNRDTNEIRILSTKDGILQKIGTISEGKTTPQVMELYLANQKLTVIYRDIPRLFKKQYSYYNYYGYYYGGYYEEKTGVAVYDVRDPQKPQKIGSFTQSGSYEDSRVIGDTLYLISNDQVSAEIDPEKPETFVPTVKQNGKMQPIAAERVYRYSFGELESRYTVIAAVDLNTATATDATSVFGGVGTVYCSTENLVLARDGGREENIEKDFTSVTRFALRNGKVLLEAGGRIDGSLLNQYSMDEYEDTFRFVTTVCTYHYNESDHSLVDFHAKLTVLDENLKETGTIDDIAPGERVYSARFMGDAAYFVTFRQTDPLFSVDLSDPNNPKIIGALKIPGFSDYLFPYGDGKLLGVGQDADPETGRAGCIKISLFNIHDPANVTESNTVYIEDSRWSPALFDPKACYVDAAEGLVGLNCEEPVSDEDVDFRYRVFDFANGGKERFSITGESIKAYDQDGWRINREYNLRGLRIERAFYVVGTNFAAAVDIDTGEELSRVSLIK